MVKRARLVCECGAEIPRPVPVHCPRCGAIITSVRTAWWPRLRGAVLALALFAALIAYVLWLLQK